MEYKTFNEDFNIILKLVDQIDWNIIPSEDC